MNPTLYLELKQKIIDLGYAYDIEWAENVSVCPDKYSFFREYVFVIINSGMKAQIALKIFKTVWNQLCSGGRPEDVFGHRGKCQAIMDVFINLDKYWNEYQSVENKIDYVIA